MWGTLMGYGRLHYWWPQIKGRSTRKDGEGLRRWCLVGCNRFFPQFLSYMHPRRYNAREFQVSCDGSGGDSILV